MPFIPHTPESLFARSDSKNPASTCRGLTANGRPCRRGLAASPQPRPGAFPHGKSPDPSSLLCWQHKSQAEQLSPRIDQTIYEHEAIKKRSSIDSMAERLGLASVRTGLSMRHHRERTSSARQNVAAQDSSPSILSIICCMLPESGSNDPGKELHAPRHARTSGSGKQRTSGPAMTSIDERRRPIVVPSEAQQGFTVPTQKVRGSNSEHTERRDWNNDHQSSHEITFQSKRVSVPERPQKQSMRPILPHNSLSETQDLLKLIPGSLSPVVTSQLLTELAKPISSMDEEGYIYMFWLSDAEHTPTPSSTAASSLLVTPRSSDVKKQQAQATSLLRETAVDGSITGKETQTRKQVLVKIGRASNVQRRMNEWQRQCGFNLSLIRYYPYVPSSSSARQTPSPSPSPLPSPGTSPGPSTPTKVPHVYRVERLIHLELAESRMKKNCLACGKEHREWFSIDASRDGIRAVDGVVRRWVAWAEHQNSISLR